VLQKLLTWPAIQGLALLRVGDSVGEFFLRAES
jgi:hypothetical protein